MEFSDPNVWVPLALLVVMAAAGPEAVWDMLVIMGLLLWRLCLIGTLRVQRGARRVLAKLGLASDRRPDRPP